MKITSSGIIKNEDKPRCGVTSNVSSDFLDEILTQGIDLGFEQAYEETKAQVIADCSDGDCDPEQVETETQERLGLFESNGPYIYGDWVKNAEGLYEIDQNGKHGFAVTLSTETGTIVTVEYSNITKLCHHTSPCFTMANGDGPCGDLDTPGDSVLAYSLPDGYFSNDIE